MMTLVLRWRERLRRVLVGRLLGRSVDALMAARAPHEDSLFSLWIRGGFHSRAECIVRIGERLSPRLVGGIRASCLRTVTIDGEIFTATPFNRGRATTVYCLQPGAKVIKVYRNSLGLRGVALRSLARGVQRGDRELRAWYSDCQNLLVTSRLLVVRSPALGIAAVATLQPLIRERPNDFFRDFNDDQLIALIAADTVLRQQFHQFVLGTRQALATGSRCFDMYGLNNLMLLKKPAGWRMCIVDCGVYDLEERRRRVPAIHQRIVALHQRLEALHDHFFER